MKIRTKILAGQGIILTLLLLLGVTILIIVKSLDPVVGNLEEDINTLNRINTIDQLIREIGSLRGALQQITVNYINNPNESVRIKYNFTSIKLNEAINDALRESQSGTTLFNVSVVEANIEDIEKNIFNLVKQGDVKEARVFKASTKYKVLNQNFSLFLNQLVYSIKSEAQDEFSRLIQISSTIQNTKQGLSYWIRFIFIFCAGLFVIGLIFSIIIANSISRPINQLKDATIDIGIGKLNSRIDIKSNDEIASLSQSFNQMTDNLLQRTQELERKTRDIIALQIITAIASQSLEFDTVMQELIEKIRKIFNFDATRIFLFNREMDELHLRASYAPKPDFPQVRSFRRGQGNVGKVAETGEPLIFENIHTDPRYQKLSYTKNTNQAGYSFLAIFPIKTKLMTVGTIVCVGQDPRHIEADEINLILSMSNQIGIAVENGKLYEQTKEQAEHLKKEIIERKHTENQLIQAAKLAGLGELGAGIAHELNQPITIIQGFTQRIKRDIGRQVAVRADELDLIINASHRMARIVDNIRLFSRQSDFKPQLIDPLAPIDNALMLINEQLRLHGIEVERPAGDGLPRVMGDQVKLQQVFSNLIMNARDALGTLPKGRPRRLVLGVRAEGDRVVYSVEDSGPGISEEDQARIFDPFFTTKEVGKGTGLGLSISHGIVKDHGGEIRYEPVEGGGAHFIVSLPIAPVETTEAVEGYEQGEQKYIG